LAVRAEEGNRCPSRSTNGLDRVPTPLRADARTPSRRS
jgi:hypothetical protein